MTEQQEKRGSLLGSAFRLSVPKPPAPIDPKDVHIEDVLHNKLPEPLTRENFRQFLVSEFAEENLEFFEHVEIFRSSFTLKLQNSRGSVTVRKDEFRISIIEYEVQIDNPIQSPEVPNSEKGEESGPDIVIPLEADVLKELEMLRFEQIEEIKTKFIDPGSPKEVNISADQRNKLLDLLNQAASEKVTKPNLFDEAIREVKSLMSSGPFPRFLKTIKTKNLSKTHSTWRILVGSEILFFGLLIEAGFYCLQYLTDITVFDSSLWRLIPFPLFYLAILNILAGKYGLCPFFAMKGVYLNAVDSADWKKVLLRKIEKMTVLQRKRIEERFARFGLNVTLDVEGISHCVRDNGVILLHVHIAKIIAIKTLICSVVLTALFVFLPPQESYF